MRRFVLSLAAASMVATAPLAAQVAPAQIEQLKTEGMERSQVMAIAAYLTDVIGPRLTNSPGMRKAEEWTAAKFRQWGLSNVHKEGFEFGRGWWVKKSEVRMTGPRDVELTATPIAWTPGTNGMITAPVVLAPIRGDADLEKWRGKLSGKIVLITAPKSFGDQTTGTFRRFTDTDLEAFGSYKVPAATPSPARGGGGIPDWATFPERRNSFLKEEGALAFVQMAPQDGKLLDGSAYQFRLEDAPGLPGFEVAAEDYLRLTRLIDSGAAPTVSLMSDVGFDDSDTKAYNIIAEIPGTDPKAGYVMAGAHLDSWAAGDGATDNAAGSAMVMEAARILIDSGVKPRRTIRFVLWNGEEQGLLGSMDYVERHIATRPLPEGASGIGKYVAWTSAWPITLKPGHKDLVAYFNIDNGSGKIRGINAQHNSALVPIFTEWLAPFAGMGATTVSLRKVGGTDHVFFDAVGIPAFQFIQDPLDYFPRTHHTSIDTYDHLRAEDMKQGSVILATFLLQAANSPQPLPRLPIPSVD